MVLTWISLKSPALWAQTPGLLGLEKCPSMAVIEIPKGEIPKKSPIVGLLLYGQPLKGPVICAKCQVLVQIILRPLVV